MINKRGEETRQVIKNCACVLFANKGFKQVTMKDICESAKISRGGLYCHYGSTQEIFKEIINDFMSQQGDTFSEKIAQNLSAIEILNDVLERYRKEMLDSQSSLSLAIYEYFSIEDNAGAKNELYTQYLASLNAWRALMEYGIKKGEFNDVDIVSVFNLIIFSYQGVRMYSKLMPIDEDIPRRIIEQIKKILVKE
uniref:TetR/AcrR family transcriptional regulator n=1 Tax=Blautia glucerasea TaxID=536633 RepID=UPI00191F48F3|nr:TetR/AcrR family transcriptional regulator [Blautia glucerasea]